MHIFVQMSRAKSFSHFSAFEQRAAMMVVVQFKHFFSFGGKCCSWSAFCFVPFPAISKRSRDTTCNVPSLFHLSEGGKESFNHAQHFLTFAQQTSGHHHVRKRQEKQEKKTDFFVPMAAAAIWQKRWTLKTAAAAAAAAAGKLQISARESRRDGKSPNVWHEKLKTS